MKVNAEELLEEWRKQDPDLTDVDGYLEFLDARIGVQRRPLKTVVKYAIVETIMP